MKKQIKKYLPLLEYISKLEVHKRKPFIKKLKKKNSEFLFDLLANFYQGNLPVAKEIIDQLRPYREVIASLVAPRKSLKARKTQLVEDDYYPLLITPLLPSLQQLAT